MRKLLLPVDKHTHYEVDPQRHSHLISLRHSLKFNYLVREVTLHYCHRQFESLADSIDLTLEHNNSVFHVDLSEKTYKEQDNKTIKVIIPVDNIMAETLELAFCFSQSNIQKLMQSLMDSQLQPMLSSKDSPQTSKKFTLPQMLSVCFLGVQLLCYNMDIYQSIESSVDLMNIADKLMKAHRCNDAHLATIHLASVAKHKSRWNEAESYLLELRQRVDLKMQQQILLNLIDTVPEAMTKLKYIIQLSKLNKGRTEQNNGQAIGIKPSTLFKQSKLLIEIVAKHADLSTFLGFCTYLNIVTFFVNEVACSIADSLMSIIGSIINFARNKKLWKKIKTQSQQNYLLLVGSIDLFFESVRCCSLSFTPSYSQQYILYLLDHVYLEETSLIRRPLVLLLNSFITKQINGLTMRFQQWFSVAFYAEGHELIKHFQVDLKLHTSKDCKQQMAALEQDIKNIALFNLSTDAMNKFVMALSHNFVQLMLSSQINFLLLHHFLQLTNVFCIACSQHNSDIKPGFTAALLPLYKPLKMLIGKLLQLNIQPVDVFKKAWEIFVEFFTTVDDYLDETLLDIIISMLNKHLLRGEIILTELPFLDVVCENLTSFSNTSGQYSQLIQKVFGRVCELIPNSVYTDSVYALLEKFIVFRPKVLQDNETLLKLLNQLTDPYTDQDDRWRQFVGDVGKRVLTFDAECMRQVIEYLCERIEVDAKTQRKRSHQQIKCNHQRQVRRVHILNRWLKLSRDMQIQSSLKERLPDIGDSLIGRLHLIADTKQLNLYFHKYYCICKHLSLVQVELNCSYFSLFQMEYAPIVYSCLVLMASSRQQVSPQQYDTHFRVALSQIDSPWKNIHEISLLLLAYFALPSNEDIAAVLSGLMSSEQVYPKLIALSILNGFSMQYEKMSESERINSPIPSLIRTLSETITDLFCSYSIKQLELIIYYVVYRLHKQFGVSLNEFQGQYQLSTEEETNLLQILALVGKIDTIVNREFAKDSQDYIKSEISLPRKTQNTTKMNEEIETLIEPSQQSEPTKMLPQIHPKDLQLPQQQAPAQLVNQRVPIRQIHIHLNTPKTPPVSTINGSKKPIHSDAAKLFTTPSQSSNSAHKQKQLINNNKSNRTPKQTHILSNGQSKHSSPIVQVESRHEKFKINLSHLKDKWRQGLEMIHKKKDKQKLSKRKSTNNV